MRGAKELNSLSGSIPGRSGRYPHSLQKPAPPGSSKAKWGGSIILGLYRDNGKENGNYYIILGLYKDNGKENGNYYVIIGYVLGIYKGKYWDNGKENGNYYVIIGYVLGLYWGYIK